MTLEKLKLRASKMRPDLPLVSVIDKLAALWKGPGTKFNPEDAGLPLPAQAYAAFLLLDSEPLYILSSRWIFEDELGEMFEIDYATLATALRQRSFRHPTTGDDVPDFMQRIGIEYTSGRALDEAMV